jgi:hypothetical protein
MFRLATVEAAALRSQTVISNVRRGGRCYLPYAFTEQGVAMLSSVPRSQRAIRVNVEICERLSGYEGCWYRTMNSPRRWRPQGAAGAGHRAGRYRPDGGALGSVPAAALLRLTRATVRLELVVKADNLLNEPLPEARVGVVARILRRRDLSVSRRGYTFGLIGPHLD